MKKIIFAFIALVTLILIGCGNPTLTNFTAAYPNPTTEQTEQTEQSVVELQIYGVPEKIVVGDTFTLSTASRSIVTWISSDNEIVIVERERGIVTALKEGTVKIQASEDDKTALVEITIEAPVYYSVKFEFQKAELNPGEYELPESFNSEILEGTVIKLNNYNFEGYKIIDWDYDGRSVNSDITVTINVKKIYIVEYNVHGWFTDEDCTIPAVSFVREYWEGKDHPDVTQYWNFNEDDEPVQAAKWKILNSKNYDFEFKPIIL